MECKGFFAWVLFFSFFDEMMLKLILWMCYAHLFETRAQRGYGVWRVYGGFHSISIYL